jgi:cell division GTPase FtsZ
MKPIEFKSEEEKQYYNDAWNRYLIKRGCLQRVLANKENYHLVLQPTPMKTHMPKTMKEARAEINSLRETNEQLRKDLDSQLEKTKQANVSAAELRRENNMLVGLLKSISNIAGTTNTLTYKY